MAIDPATAKILAQIALKAVTDEETRKKIVMIALIPVVSVLLVLTMFQYLITHPWEYFETILSGSEVAPQVKQFHDLYYIEPRKSNENKDVSSEYVSDEEKVERENEEEIAD